MKHIVILILLNLIIGCASTQKALSDDLYYQQIHNYPSISKDEIYTNTLSWLAENFVDSKSVIQLKDKENGKIIVKGMTDFLNMGVASIPTRFTMIIDIKDEKARVEYKNWIGMWGEYRNRPNPITTLENANKVKQKLINLDTQLKTYILSGNKDTGVW